MTGCADNGGLGATAIALSPDGRNAYVASAADAIAVYRRVPLTPGLRKPRWRPKPRAPRKPEARTQSLVVKDLGPGIRCGYMLARWARRARSAPCSQQWWFCASRAGPSRRSPGRDLGDQRRGVRPGPDRQRRLHRRTFTEMPTRRRAPALSRCSMCGSLGHGRDLAGWDPNPQRRGPRSRPHRTEARSTPAGCSRRRRAAAFPPRRAQRCDRRGRHPVAVRVAERERPRPGRRVEPGLRGRRVREGRGETRSASRLSTPRQRRSTPAGGRRPTAWFGPSPSRSGRRDVYAGGDFGAVSGHTRLRAAALDPVDGDVAQNWRPDPANRVFSLGDEGQHRLRCRRRRLEQPLRMERGDGGAEMAQALGWRLSGAGRIQRHGVRRWALQHLRG